jgi:hypothetical protein
MFFKKGLRDPSLIRKLAMKNSRMSEAMFDAKKKSALLGELTPNTGKRRRKGLGPRRLA